METFPLPTLGAVLLQIRNQVCTGIGFTVVRGLDLGEFDHEARAIVFLGLSSYIGEERGPQDFLGTMISKIG